MSLRVYQKFCCLGILIWAALPASLIFSATVFAVPPGGELAKALPSDLGDYHQTQPLKPSTSLEKEGFLRPEYFPSNTDPTIKARFITSETEYTSKAGDKLAVEMVRFATDSEAYSLLTLVARKLGEGRQPVNVDLANVGTASARDVKTVVFFKGTTFTRVTHEEGKNPDSTLALANLVAGNLDKGEDDVPVLLKHLPQWLTARQQSLYAVSPGPLREVITGQPVLDAISFDGGTEAIVANYDRSKLLIVEFTTPQFSIDNDQKIWTRLNELKSKGESTPSAYRRVGNYSVFVFNAADEKTANALIDQVKYEQVVQWLGDDPHLYERLQRYLTQTSAGVLVAVLKSSGLSLLFCVAAGALLGTMLFRHRRAQRAAAYSDAGGSVRLNLDELTGPTKQRLLEQPKTGDSANT